MLLTKFSICSQMESLHRGFWPQCNLRNGHQVRGSRSRVLLLVFPLCGPTPDSGIAACHYFALQCLEPPVGTAQSLPGCSASLLHPPQPNLVLRPHLGDQHVQAWAHLADQQVRPHVGPVGLCALSHSRIAGATASWASQAIHSGTQRVMTASLGIPAGAGLGGPWRPAGATPCWAS